MPRTRLLVSVLILLGSSLCVRSCCADTIAHEQKLWRLEGSFRDVTHPAATALVTKRSRVGLLLGNGNHCDSFVGELRRTALSKELIREAYAPQRSRGVEVAFFDEPSSIEYVPYDFQSLQGWGVTAPAAPGERYYFAYEYLGGEDAAGDDWRCH